MNQFSRNQNDGVSVKFATVVSSAFLLLGAGLYFQPDFAYGLFDNLITEIKMASLK